MFYHVNWMSSHICQEISQEDITITCFIGGRRPHYYQFEWTQHEELDVFSFPFTWL